MNFVTQALQKGGKISPLIIDDGAKTNGTALFNPSIYNDNGRLILNLRHCQYTLYHSELNIYEHQWGPLVYLNPEDDISLTTQNYFCEINKDTLRVDDFVKIDTSKHDIKPIWEFVGLEDARVFRWEGKLYISGVRRDTTTNGQGRMELSEIVEETDGTVKEVSRWRIPAPPPNDSYCEKNWMPVLDMPWHFVKWSNPTQVVKVDPVKKTCETAFLSDKYVEKPYDFRGGSHVISVGEYKVAISHVVDLFKSKAGRKNATYRHAFIVWDKNWNVVKYGEPFSFMDGKIEFCVGFAEQGEDYLISFGFQDNAAYLLSVPKKFIQEIVYGN